jgi:hypothetical protein
LSSRVVARDGEEGVPKFEQAELDAAAARRMAGGG